MSIEYTIDIQLTELGFPDLGETPETTGGQTDSSSGTELKKSPGSCTSAALSPARKRKTPTANQKDVDQKTAEAEPESSASSLTAVDVDDEDDKEDSEDSDVSLVGDEEEDDYEAEEIGEGEFDEDHLPGDYRCNVCDLLLSSEFKLQDHMNLHTGARPYCCAECGKRFCQISNYRAHLRTHAGKKVDHLMCRVCWVGFTSQVELNQHLATSHLEDRFYECDLCKRVFTTLLDCQTHVELHKREVQDSAASQDLFEFPCKKCGKKFPTRKSLARHRKSRCFTIFKCTDCPKTFPERSSLLRHTFSHLGLLPYTCVRCRRHFRLARLYYQHKCQPQRIHCVACLREFLCQGDFEQHKKDTGCWGNQEPETDEVRCLECGQRFKSAEELKSHAGAHQRVLSCAECGKGFRSALLLMSHMGGHAGQSPCLCQACGIGFPHQQNYDSHLKTCSQKPESPQQPNKPNQPKRLSGGSSKRRSKPESSASSVPAVTREEPTIPDDVENITGRAGPAEEPGKLTLNQEPPPLSNIILLLPVCENLSNNQLMVSPGTSVTPPVTPALENEPFPVCKPALDLSRQRISSVPTPPLSIKTEPEEPSGVGKQDDMPNGSPEIELKEASETSSVAKTIGLDTQNLEQMESTLPILITDVRTEAEGAEAGAPESCPPAKKEIKM